MLTAIHLPPRYRAAGIAGRRVAGQPPPLAKAAFFGLLLPTDLNLIDIGIGDVYGGALTMITLARN